MTTILLLLLAGLVAFVTFILIKYTRKKTATIQPLKEYGYKISYLVGDNAVVNKPLRIRTPQNDSPSRRTAMSPVLGAPYNLNGTQNDSSFSDGLITGLIVEDLLKSNDSDPSSSYEGFGGGSFGGSGSGGDWSPSGDNSSGSSYDSGSSNDSSSSSDYSSSD